MIIMAVDYGDARTGLAVCDEGEILAYGAGLIDRPGFKKVAAEVARRAEELGAELIRGAPSAAISPPRWREFPAFPRSCATSV